MDFICSKSIHNKFLKITSYNIINSESVQHSDRENYFIFEEVLQSFLVAVLKTIFIRRLISRHVANSAVSTQ